MYWGIGGSGRGTGSWRAGVIGGACPPIQGIGFPRLPIVLRVPADVSVDAGSSCWRLSANAVPRLPAFTRCSRVVACSLQNLIVTVAATRAR